MTKNNNNSLKQIMIIIRVVFFLSASGITFYYHTRMVEHLALIVGLIMIASNAGEFMLDITAKRYQEKYNLMALHISSIIVGLILVFQIQNQLAYVCIIWGMFTMVETCFDVTDTIYKKVQGDLKSWIFLVDEFAEMILAILLIIDPLNHVGFHVRLLAIEFLLEGLKVLRAFIKTREQDSR